MLIPKRIFKLITNAKILLVIRDYNEVINSLIIRSLKPKIEQIKHSSRLGWLRLLIYRFIELKREKARLREVYSNALVTYYNHLSYINKLVDSNIRSKFCFNKVDAEDNNMLEKVEEWGFQLNNKVNLNTILKPSYIKANKKCKYVFNRKTIEVLQLQIIN
ncbi:hypothetical protein E9993_15635 [Labilibacter sediminis]|nr:hypothetical protein E9993_15635 [Labilibacter sediminis]